MFAYSARVVVAFAVMVAVGLHVVVSLLLSLDTPYYATNLVSSPSRHLLLGVVLGGFALSVVAGALMVVRDSARATTALHRLVRLVCPVIILPLFIALLRHNFGTDAEEALLLGFFAIGLDALLRVSFEAWAEWPADLAPSVPGPPRGILPRLSAGVTGFFARPGLVLGTVILLAVGHAIYMAVFGVWSHQRFGTFGFDLGQYDQIFQSTLHGRPLALPALSGSPDNWGDLDSSHADLATFYLLPIYALYPRAEMLLVMQAVIVAAATVPLYLFASNHLPRWIALCVALAWLLYAPLHGAMLYDVHMQPFGASWAIFAIAAVDRRRFKLYWVFFVLAILCREDVSIGLTMLGVFLALSGERVKTGIVTAVVAVAYFVALRFVVMGSTAFTGMYKNLTAPGEPDGFGSVIKTLISNPAFVCKTLLSWEKARYFAQIFAPLAFLPLRRLRLWIFAVPGFILTLLTTEYMPTIQTSFQYVSNWAAYMFPATVVALALYRKEEGGERKQRSAALSLLAASIVSSVQWGAYSPNGSVHGGFLDVPFVKPSEADYKREEGVQSLMKKVPENAKLCTSDRVQAHTTYHLDNYSLKGGVMDCDYLLWTDVPGDMGSEIGNPTLGKGYELVERRSGVTLARKKKPPAPPPAVAPPQPALPAPAVKPPGQ